MWVRRLLHCFFSWHRYFWCRRYSFLLPLVRTTSDLVLNSTSGRGGGRLRQWRSILVFQHSCPPPLYDEYYSGPLFPAPVIRRVLFRSTPVFIWYYLHDTLVNVSGTNSLIPHYYRVQIACMYVQIKVLFCSLFIIKRVENIFCLLWYENVAARRTSPPPRLRVLRNYTALPIDCNYCTTTTAIVLTLILILIIPVDGNYYINHFHCNNNTINSKTAVQQLFWSPFFDDDIEEGIS